MSSTPEVLNGATECHTAAVVAAAGEAKKSSVDNDDRAIDDDDDAGGDACARMCMCAWLCRVTSRPRSSMLTDRRWDELDRRAEPQPRTRPSQKLRHAITGRRRRQHNRSPRQLIEEYIVCLPSGLYHPHADDGAGGLVGTIRWTCTDRLRQIEPSSADRSITRHSTRNGVDATITRSPDHGGGDESRRFDGS
jgi:hypothetical protein